MKDTLCHAQKMHAQAATADDARMTAIFRERAERLAAGNGRVQTAEATTAVLVLTLGGETYGIELQHVAKVFPDTRVTPVPGAPESLLGIANLQGEVRSVFGLRSLLTLPDGDHEASRYILLMRLKDRRIGLLVENIQGVRQYALNNLSEYENRSADNHADYVHGVTHDKVVVLRIDDLLPC